MQLVNFIDLTTIGGLISLSYNINFILKGINPIRTSRTFCSMHYLIKTQFTTSNIINHILTISNTFIVNANTFKIININCNNNNLQDKVHTFKIGILHYTQANHLFIVLYF